MSELLEMRKRAEELRNIINYRLGVKFGIQFPILA